MKEYFSHDYHARNDSKMIQLIMQHGLNGIGAYWCIIEMLYESGGYLMQSECERIAFELRTQCDLIKSVINSDLFQKDDEKFWSDSVHRRLDLRSQKSDKARESAFKRWNNKDLQDNANAMRTQCDGNAIKVNKRKEKKSNTTSSASLTKELESFETPLEFKEIWGVWIDYKKRQHGFKFKTDNGEKVAFENLVQLSGNNPAVAKLIINQSMSNGWKGLFALKNENKPEPKSDVNRTNEVIEKIKKMKDGDV